MVGLFSWLSKKEDINYEKILSELDDKISQSEMRIAEYGLLVYALYYRWSDGEPWNQFLLKSVPVVAMPIIIYLGRAGITAWYQRCRVVQGLIDRYDGPKSNKSRDGQKLPKGSDKTLDTKSSEQSATTTSSQSATKIPINSNSLSPGSPLQLERNISHTHAPNPHHPNSIPSRNATPLQLQHNPQPIRRYSQQQHNAQNSPYRTPQHIISPTTKYPSREFKHAPCD
ncbi:hypothetical protein BASA83_006346 [Batrachochytrium salamandrivorans]|nr:hypothetical protein BASA83_006346 [Batrachochytrium salamandrivorans]